MRGVRLNGMLRKGESRRAPDSSAHDAQRAHQNGSAGRAVSVLPDRRAVLRVAHLVRGRFARVRRAEAGQHRAHLHHLWGRPRAGTLKKPSAWAGPDGMQLLHSVIMWHSDAGCRAAG